jgi:hypothetical protein
MRLDRSRIVNATHSSRRAMTGTRSLVKTPTARLTLTALALACATALSEDTAAQTMHVDSSGRGQVLIFPYYTVRNGTYSFVSLVNETNNAKALKVRVREAMGGRPVADFNVFLSAKDIWTGGIIPTTDGAAIISNDKSCTLPKFDSAGTPLAFSNTAYAAESAAAFATLDRTREGYLEVLEMATVPNLTALGKNVTHVGGVPSCTLVAEASTPAIQTTLTAPSGGLFGSMSFINPTDGMSVSYNATAISGFWKTGAGTTTSITAPGSATPDLTSGGNGMITVTDKGKTYVSTFAQSIDAVSALFMNSSFGGEYAFTSDGVFSNAFVVMAPTKPYYIYRGSSLNPVLPTPYQRVFNGMAGQSCDDIVTSSYDREIYVPITGDSLTPQYLPIDFRAICGVVSTVEFAVTGYIPYVGLPGTGLGSEAATATAFHSPQTKVASVPQNQGRKPITLGQEGGHLFVTPVSPNGFLVPLSTQQLSRSATTGELEWTNVAYTYFGMPMIGFMLSVSKYNAGSPQQNFGNLNPLSMTRTIRAAY